MPSRKLGSYHVYVNLTAYIRAIQLVWNGGRLINDPKQGAGKKMALNMSNHI